MHKDDMIRMAREVGFADMQGTVHAAYQLEQFAALVAAKEREAILQAIEAVYTLEEDRNPMFSDGYKYALDQIETLIRARGQ